LPSSCYIQDRLSTCPSCNYVSRAILPPPLAPRIICPHTPNGSRSVNCILLFVWGFSFSAPPFFPPPRFSYPPLLLTLSFDYPAIQTPRPKVFLIMRPDRFPPAETPFPSLPQILTKGLVKIQSPPPPRPISYPGFAVRPLHGSHNPAHPNPQVFLLSLHNVPWVPVSPPPFLTNPSDQFPCYDNALPLSKPPNLLQVLRVFSSFLCLQKIVFPPFFVAGQRAPTRAL